MTPWARAAALNFKQASRSVLTNYYLGRAASGEGSPLPPARWPLFIEPSRERPPPPRRRRSPVGVPLRAEHLGVLRRLHTAILRRVEVALRLVEVEVKVEVEVQIVVEIVRVEAVGHRMVRDADEKNSVKNRLAV